MLLVCIDGRLYVESLQAKKKVVLRVHCLPFKGVFWKEPGLADPAAGAWHPSGGLVAIANRRGRIYFFDIALVPICVALANGSYFDCLSAG